jgi:methylated-DNA-[protein]-cysteine S-methyltransferase
MRYDVTRCDSPLGQIVVATTDDGVHAIEFTTSDRPDGWRFSRRLADAEFARNDRGRDVAGRLTRWFGGDVAALDDVRVAAVGTPFQRRVWAALRRIPAGETTTYGRLAADIGRPSASRAVGAANGANPVAIVVPCHRVVGADGTLTGYAGGLERKRFLLRHEAGVRSLAPNAGFPHRGLDLIGDARRRC